MEYWYLFVWMILMVFLANFLESGELTDENGYMQWQVGWGLALLAFAPILYMTVFEKAIGDVPAYISEYISMPDTLKESIAYVKNQRDSYLFYILMMVIRKLSGGNIFIFRMTIALLQSLPVIYILRKYSDEYMLSVFIFIASGYPIAWMMNGIRQYVAVVIIFLAAPLLEEKEYVKMIVVILIASLFHQTAIIMLPIIFVVQGDAWNWKTLTAIAGIVGLTIYFSRASGSFESVMDVMGYSSIDYSADDGTNPFRVLVYAVPVILAYIAREEIEDDDIPIMNISVNMSIITVGIYLVSMVTSGILVGRVPIYVSLYSLILYPYVLKKVFEDSDYKFVLGILVICYLLYYYVQYG